MKKNLVRTAYFATMLGLCFGNLYAQKKGDAPSPAAPPATTTAPEKKEIKTGPKPYKEVITDKAKTTKGLFTVHKIEDKFYFEIADSLLGREVMAITRLAKTPDGAGYGGEQANKQVLRWEKTADNKLLLRVALFLNASPDSLQPIAKAVRNSNVEPIIGAFDIKAFRKDTSTVIDITDFFKGDNQAVSLQPLAKSFYKLTSLQADRSFIQSIKSFPINTEVRTIKTFGVTPPSLTPSPVPSPGVALPAGIATGVATFEVNTSMILLPKTPTRQRIFDPRVGYFASDFTVYDDNAHKTEERTFVVRYKLEPKNDADAERQKKGELIEPKKPIVYYIDPATPIKWRKYLKQGVDDWQVAFEQAGWKNAIRGEILSDNDTTINMEDARYCAIRYFASDIENAYGPNVHDPRSGEIIESHVGWYHNVMKLLHDWYMTQTGATDSRSRKVTLDDDLMGQLIRFVSSHEIGHTIGLRHNMGASNATPVEKLRDKNFVATNGHTSSIMDYARFNYVAQPEDGVTDFFPRIGDYDKWAIEWAYKPIYDTKDAEEDKKILNKWYLDKAYPNRRLWFLTETNSYDPRSQTEDLGDNSMLASEYGIKNLKRIIPNLVEWTKQESETYEELEIMYQSVAGQFKRYIGHVTKNVGGIFETPKTYDQAGVVYDPAPRSQQKDAVLFLNRQLFETPVWLIDQTIMNRIRPDFGLDMISKLQENTLNSLLATDRLQRIIETTNKQPAAAYSLDEFFSDIKTSIWSEVKAHRSIDNYRRNLQKVYIEKMAGIISPSVSFIPSPASSFFGTKNPASIDVRKSDVSSTVRGYLMSLRDEIKTALPFISDKMSKYHLQDCIFRIEKALDPK